MPERFDGRLSTLAAPAEIQAALLDVLADETTVYPDNSSSLPAHALCPAIGWTEVFTTQVAANLTAMKRRGLVWRNGGPGSGAWCITREGLALARPLRPKEICDE